MPEIFDLFVKNKNVIPEKYRKFLDRARLFIFNIYPTETLNQADLTNMMSTDMEFHLPFPVVAVEDKVSCAVIWDLGEETFGFNAPRMVMEFAPIKNYTDPRAYKTGESNPFKDSCTESSVRDAAECLSERYKYSFRMGEISAYWDAVHTKWLARSVVHETALFNDCSDYLDVHKDMELGASDACSYDFSRACLTVFEELLHLSRPDTFILESSAERKHKKQGKYALTRERPTYTVVHPGEARKIMQLPEPIPKKEGGRILLERRSYWRRSHERHLKADIYKEKKVIQVKRAFVPSYWNGASESVVGNKKYRVILKDYSEQ